MQGVQPLADVVDVETRSRMMAGIRGKNTGPEIRLRKALHRAGLRYRLHSARLPGRPDIVLPKHHAAIFVHGCFWHRHQGCRFATVPKTNEAFWQEKFARNVKRDKDIIDRLVAAGWRVCIVWGCTIGKDQNQAIIDQIVSWIARDDATLEIGSNAAQSA